MTVWYRASPTKNPQITFSGDGGLYTAGGWNHRGNKAVYCSESIALCTLEWLAHNGLSVSGFTYYRFSIEIPDELIEKYKSADLPSNWNSTPATHSTRDFAEKHLFLSEKILAIAVPSVIVPEEFNLVINSMHNAFSHIAKTIKMLGKHISPSRD